MPKNLVICCDGTNNQFGPQNTNVVRLIQALDRDPAKQRLYYDPGVGTLPEPGVVTALGKKVSDLCGLAFGAGLTWKIQEAYSYLMDYWEPGDQVYIFGFSRGAYTARVLAGLLHALGLLPRGNYNLVPYVMRLFKQIRRERSAGTTDGTKLWTKLCDDFRWTFARTVPGSGDERRFRVHFVGVWDTVSSVGWIWEPDVFPYTVHNPSIDIIRHAVSIDERRCFFRQNLMQQVGTQDIQELWFPGVHSDIGGGYSEQEGGLWRVPFGWMLDEAQKAGLLIDPQRLETVLHKSEPTTNPWNDPQHESLTYKWWPAEFFPKLRWRSGATFRMPQIGLGRHRNIPEGARMHKSVLLRLRETNYAPPNISKGFVEKVRQLPIVPEVLAVDRQS